MGILSPAIGEVGIRKQAPIISSLKKPGPNSSFHHSLQKLSHGSPIRKPLTPTHSIGSRRYTLPDKMLSKTSSEGMLLDSNKDEFADLNRSVIKCTYGFYYFNRNLDHYWNYIIIE